MVPVEVRLDSFLDEPQRMMGLVVQVAADLGQDLRCDIGEVITLVGVAKNLHGGLTSRVGGAEESTAGL